MKSKSETFEKFNEWYALIENQLKTKLTVLRIDNDLEFVLEQFNDFCKKRGIKRHRADVGTPQ